MPLSFYFQLHLKYCIGLIVTDWLTINIVKKEKLAVATDRYVVGSPTGERRKVFFLLHCH